MSLSAFYLLLFLDFSFFSLVTLVMLTDVFVEAFVFIKVTTFLCVLGFT